MVWVQSKPRCCHCGCHFMSQPKPLKEEGVFSVASKKKRKGKGKGKGSTAPRKVRCEPGTQAFADELVMDISRSGLAWSLIAQFMGKVGINRN